jgi:hypothetical protein
MATAYSVPSTIRKDELNFNGTLAIRVDYGNLFQEILRDKLVIASLFTPASEELTNFRRGRLVFEVPVLDADFTIDQYDIQTGVGEQAFKIKYDLYEVNQSYGINVPFDNPEVELTQLPVLTQVMNEVMRKYVEWFELDALKALGEDAHIVTQAINTPDEIYNSIVDGVLWHEEKLANQGDLVTVISPKTYASLKKATASNGGFAENLSDSALANYRVNGVVAQLDGVPIVKSMRLPANTAYMIINTRNLHSVMQYEKYPVLREMPDKNRIDVYQLIGRFMAGHVISRRNSVYVHKTI